MDTNEIDNIIRKYGTNVIIPDDGRKDYIKAAKLDDEVYINLKDQCEETISFNFENMDHKEKKEFLLEQGTYYPELIYDFMQDNSKEDNISFFDEFTQEYPGFVPIYGIMAAIYKDKSYLIAARAELDELDPPEEVRRQAERYFAEIEDSI